MRDFSDNEGCRRWIRNAAAGLAYGQRGELHDAS